MKLALVAPFNIGSASGEIHTLQEELLAEAWDCALRDQILVMAKFLRDGSQFEPCIICRQGSQLAQKAKGINLPCLELKTGMSILDRIKLWRWQKQAPQMLVMSVDAKALKTAKILQGMRKKKSSPLVCVFPLKASPLNKKELKIISRSDLVIGGSEYIIKNIVQEIEQNNLFLYPDTAIIQPGIEYEKYSHAKPWGNESGVNFVFGMAESLTPKSGALLIVRAMAALWQKKDLPPFEVRMFGAGSRFSEIIQESENLGIKSRLSLLSVQDLKRAGGKCNAWLAPGSADMEMPETLWTGLAAEIPVICSNSALHQERLKGILPETVIWIEENHPQDMASAMISIMSEESLREKLIENGKKELERCGANQMARRMKQILQNLVADNREDNIETESSEDVS